MNEKPAILIIDDDTSLCRLVAHWLQREGFDVPSANTATDGIAALSHTLPDAILLDVNLPDGDGLSVLQHVKRAHPRVPVVMMTTDDEVDTVVRAMQNGAWDYLTKPPNATRLLATIRNAVEKSRADLRLAQLEREAGGGGYAGMIGDSAPMRELFRQMDRVAPSDITVLIRGESGTGKELVATALHASSARKDKPFVALNCAAIPESLQESELFGHEKGAFTGANSRRAGRFEQANGGTLFLDEVGELSLPLQAKLLRALQERSFYRVGGASEIQVDVRILAATHRDLREMVAQREFREDLYYRLNVFELRVPNLRERSTDILHLADSFLSAFATRSNQPQLRLAEEVRTALLSYTWPGNVRELRNAMERASVLARNGVVRMEDLPAALSQPFTPSVSAPTGVEALLTRSRSDRADVAPLAEMERVAIIEALDRCGGNVSKVVRVLGIPRTTLYRRLKEYGLR